ncbi:MAG: L,D-transpeptidase family protein [Thermodesulfovibrionales bacterium]
MRQIRLIKKGTIALFLVIVFLSTSACSEKNTYIQITDSGLGLIIEKKTNQWRASSKKVIEGEQIYSSVLVEGFYNGRKYQPAWSHNGHLMETEALIKAAEEAYGDGLTPDYYHLSLIKSLVGKAQKESTLDQAGLADLDILLTDAFLTLSCHFSGGCVNPVTIEAEWFAKQRTVDVSSVLEQALRERQIRESLTSLLPERDSYGRLRQALGKYRDLLLKGQWPLVSDGSVLKKYLVSGRVVELRKRLAASGDLDAEGTNGGNLFDEKLEQAVILFQKRHGLKDDGSVGPATLNALNVPLDQRIRQMELNMERMRWIPGNVDQRSIVVNIANFELNVIEKEKTVLSMRAVVGKPFQRTPVFTAKMTYLVINPSWNVPVSIAQKEILKKIQNEPQYLSKQNITVLRGWGPQEKKIDPESIDWSRINANTLAYRFRQEPGPLNPLGRLKFVLPNKFDVYLHDTSSRRLFSESVRTFSHGCTRVEKPVELGEYVLQDDSRWTQEKLLTEIEKGTEQTILLPQPLNVHFVYLTAWVDEDGVLQFRNDIYKRDRQLDEALRKNPSFM